MALIGSLFPPLVGREVLEPLALLKLPKATRATTKRHYRFGGYRIIAVV